MTDSRDIAEGRRRPTTPLPEVFVEVAQGMGPLLFLGLVRERTLTPPPPRRMAESALKTMGRAAVALRKQGPAATWAAGLATGREAVALLSRLPGEWGRSLTDAQEYFRKLPTPQDRAEFLLTGTLGSLSYLLGMAVGYGTPQVDLQMRRAERPAEVFSFHGFPLVPLEIAVEWLRLVLVQVRDGGRLTPTDHRRAEAMISVVEKGQRGLSTGARASRWQKEKLGLLPGQGDRDVEVDLPGPAFAHVERLFRLLTELAEREDSP